LFSSGIAHSLSGIEKITGLLNQYWGNDKILHNNLQQYEKAVFTELRLVDMLVAGCYDTMRHFPLFNAWAMLYFAATITSEQRRLKGEPPGYFLGADDAGIQEMVTTSYAELKQILLNNQPAGQDIQNFITHVRGRIKPVNIAGLMDPDAKNMYHHTVARL
jgi:FADH2 O2-dependent halogenase